MRISTSIKFFQDRKKQQESEPRKSSIEPPPQVEIDSIKSLTSFPGLSSSYDFSDATSAGTYNTIDYSEISEKPSLVSKERNSSYIIPEPEIDSEVEEETQRTCSRCANRKKELKLKHTLARDRMSVVDNNISLVTINEEDESMSRDKSSDVDKAESFTLIIKKIIPSDELLGIKKNFQGFLLKWNFLNQPDELEFTTKHHFNYKKTYYFHISEFNYLYMSRCPLPIELYYKTPADKMDILLGRADVNTQIALEIVGKAFENKTVINNRDLVLCYKKRERIYGRLVCSCQYKGNISNYKACIPIPVKNEESLESLASYKIIDDSMSSSSLSSNKSAELVAFQNGLNMVLIRNKALRTTQEEIATELKERTTWMHEELKWRLTLQEHAILTGNDPNLVKWRQWKDEKTSTVKYRPNPNEEFNKMQVAIFEVTIIELQLNPFSRLSIDDSIKQLYIEFSFLHYSGQQMETITKLKNLDSTISFNFLKVFEIRSTDKDARQLAEMIKNNEPIQFSIISEPFPDRNASQSCVEVGHCPVRIYDLVQSRSNSLTDSFPVYDEVDGGRELGKLKLTFAGLLSLRSVALQIMTPDHFKIIR